MDTLVCVSTWSGRIGTDPALLGVMAEPLGDSLQDVLLVADVEFLYGENLAEPVGRELPELLGPRHVAEMRLQELCGSVVDVVEAVVQREEPDADAVVGSDTALQELAAQRLEVRQEEQVRRLHHVLDGLLAQSDLHVDGSSTRGRLLLDELSPRHKASLN